jgi:hypothetical protein
MPKTYDQPVDWDYDDEAVAASKKLEEAGFTEWEVVVAKENILQLDYDKIKPNKCPPKFKQILGLLAQRFEVKQDELKYEIHRSKSGKGNHVIIYLPGELSDVERTAWQATFGSDGVREALNLLRIKRNIKNPILLFMRKDRTSDVHTIPPPVGRKFRGANATTPVSGGSDTGN